MYFSLLDCKSLFKLQLAYSYFNGNLFLPLSVLMYLITFQQTISQATAAKYPRTVLHSSGSTTVRPAGQAGRMLQGQTHASVQSIKVVDWVNIFLTRGVFIKVQYKPLPNLFRFDVVRPNVCIMFLPFSKKKHLFFLSKNAFILNTWRGKKWKCCSTSKLFENLFY